MEKAQLVELVRKRKEKGESFSKIAEDLKRKGLQKKDIDLAVEQVFESLEDKYKHRQTEFIAVLVIVFILLFIGLVVFTLIKG